MAGLDMVESKETRQEMRTLLSIPMTIIKATLHIFVFLLLTIWGIPLAFFALTCGLALAIMVGVALLVPFLLFLIVL